MANTKETDEAILAYVQKKLGSPDDVEVRPGEDRFRVPTVKPYQLAGKESGKGYTTSQHVPAKPDNPFPDLTRTQVRSSLDRLVERGDLAMTKGYGGMVEFTTSALADLRDEHVRIEKERKDDYSRRFQAAKERLYEMDLLLPTESTYGGFPLSVVEGLLHLLDQQEGR